jgi:D-alanyl-lipoteichoic acid acyltransferase DltB (MBOAT superfamily)
VKSYNKEGKVCKPLALLRLFLTPAFWGGTDWKYIYVEYYMMILQLLPSTSYASAAVVDSGQ